MDSDAPGLVGRPLDGPRLAGALLHLPVLIDQAGERARRRFVEFFTAEIRNPHTRKAYARATARFLGWCERRGLALRELEPFLVTAYVEELAAEPAAASVKQHLAALRMLFDYLVVGQVLPHNPAAAGFAMIPGVLLSRGFAGWSTEQVYRAIVQYAEAELAAAQSCSPGTGQGSQGGPGGQSGKGQELADFFPEGAGGGVEDMKGDDGKDLSQAERSREEGDLAVTLTQALRADALVRSDDSLRGAFSRVVQPLCPGFDARRELAELLSAAIGRDNYSWTRPNPRCLASGAYLPALGTSLALVDPIVAIDTSASITPRLLSFMAGVCDEVLAAFPQTVPRVVYCDSAVRSTEEITAHDCPVTLSKAQGRRHPVLAGL